MWSLLAFVVILVPMVRTLRPAQSA